MNHELRKRGAFTLVELSVSMSAGSALMVLAIGLVHQSMSLSSLGRQRSDQQRAFNRLAGDFRHDVHRARKCTVESPDRIELLLPDDEVITYQSANSRVTRQQPLSDGRSRRESFELSTNSSAAFESIGQPAIATLTVVHRSQPETDKPRVDRRIVAVVGRMTVHEKGEVSP